MSQIQKELDSVTSNESSSPVKLELIKPGMPAASPLGHSTQSQLKSPFVLICAALILAIGGFAIVKNFRKAASAPLAPMTSTSSLSTQNAVILQTYKSNPKAAMTQLEALAVANPKIADLRSNAGVALLWHGDLSKAQEHLEAAVELAPEEPQFRNNLASLLIVRGQYAEADQHLKKALEINQTMKDLYLNLGILKEKQQHYIEAQKAYQQYLLLAQPTEALWEVVKERSRLIGSLAQHQLKTEAKHGSVQ